METGKIDFFNDIVDATSQVIDGGYILDFASNSCPGLRLLVRTSNSISDKIFTTKLEKFIEYANNSNTNYQFERFKSKIKSDNNYKNKVSNYLLFKINKFDVDYKLKIFSCACVDFFNGIIDYDYLVDISECIDMIFKKDIEILKSISNVNSVFKPEDLNVNNRSSESIISSARKLHMISILEEKGTFLKNILPDNPLPGQIGPDSTKSYSLSSLGKNFIKYL